METITFEYDGCIDGFATRYDTQRDSALGLWLKIAQYLRDNPIVSPTSVGEIIEKYLIEHPAISPYYIPNVDASGELTWEKTNPTLPDIEPRNISGPLGPAGPAGPAGSDAVVTRSKIIDVLGYTPADIDAITNAWSSSKNYAVGDYCIASNTLFRAVSSGQGHNPLTDTERVYWMYTNVMTEIPMVWHKGQICENYRLHCNGIVNFQAQRIVFPMQLRVGDDVTSITIRQHAGQAVLGGAFSVSGQIKPAPNDNVNGFTASDVIATAEKRNGFVELSFAAPNEGYWYIRNTNTKVAVLTPCAFEPTGLDIIFS